MKVFTLLLITAITFSLNAAEATVETLVNETNVTVKVDPLIPPGPAVDVLFVVDDSGSMAAHQEHLSTFVSELDPASLDSDFHIGVITTDSEDRTGQLRITDDGARYITPDSLNFLDQLSNLLQVGTGGGWIEQFFTSFREALSEPLVSTTNKGFYRADANLALILLSDAEDQGEMTAWDAGHFLYELKQGDLSKVIVSSITVPKNEGDCPQDSGNPVKIEEFTRLLNGKVYNLCTLEQNDVDDIVRRSFPPDVTRVPRANLRGIQLVGEPISASIRVHYGTQAILNDAKLGWTYDPAARTVTISKTVPWSRQARGTRIEIDYQVPHRISN